MLYLIFGMLVVILLQTTMLLLKDKAVIKDHFSNREKIYVDTSALMDGRILQIVEAGFLNGRLLIPRSVVRELQLLADGKDNERRAKARAGLDLVDALERSVNCQAEILEDALDGTLVDERLLELARENGGAVLTLDFNLGKVAKTEGVKIININQLVLALRQDFLPSEKFAVKIITNGNKQQGVGYMPDGTMVVVEGAKSKIGQEVEVEFSNFVQTASGRMVFARLVEIVPVPKRSKATGRMNAKAKKRIAKK